MDPKLASKAMQQHKNNGLHVEESVDELIRKLENQGKKIKIINDDEDIESDIGEQPMSSARKTQGKMKKQQSRKS